ncbi:dihydroneopterin aldolase [Porphyromonas crevioricanis JCM 15906]|uniref:7,8-dihydroneopterin aldolase n=2 Tax=Porphyromonas crevioricanis TaxID=393921 RepID=A0A2X4PLQ9_9PORP|nr:dihydroneopterin aldolase [Porphyromonas crevioricanis]KGN93186.1 hypothetical protein HQ38_09300 [Porphyromonas crevioricanis]SJZ96809.1 dihydroneopterin aldolase [Porphyromonas crevioricanis]SQH73740.1 Dihydroneopterin aldolase [Porphyromonas crevioricanis]GAD05039.1 dihydroneopterin aldolase [Porphyromonas crevioricanis JCM 15906]GAD08152.1 dihydroneopterin aldolase [Porphyromonas crevioricanis JCM 13913]
MNKIEVKGSIRLHEMKFYAYHGVLPQEREVGNTFILDLNLETDLTKASFSDNIEDTISYADIYMLVKREMDIPSLLLEHVAGRILRCIAEEYPNVESACITIAKQNPPFGGDVKSASVSLSYIRS